MAPTAYPEILGSVGCTVFQDPWCQGWSAGSLGPRGGTAAPSFSSRAEAVDEAGASLRRRRPGREQAQMGLRGAQRQGPARRPPLTWAVNEAGAPLRWGRPGREGLRGMAWPGTCTDPASSAWLAPLWDCLWEQPRPLGLWF